MNTEFRNKLRDMVNKQSVDLHMKKDFLDKRGSSGRYERRWESKCVANNKFQVIMTPGRMSCHREAGLSKSEMKTIVAMPVIGGIIGSNSLHCSL